MNNSLTKKLTSLLIYGYFFAFLLCSIVPAFISSYASVSLIIESVVMILIFVLNFKIILKDRIAVVLLVLSILLGLVSVFFTHGGEGSIINLVRFLFGVTVFSAIEPNVKYQKYLRLLCEIIWLYCVVSAPFIWSLYKEGDAFYNPNTIGDAIFFTSTILIHFIKGKNRKYSVITVTILTLIGILLSQCRSALIAEVLYILILYVPFLRKIIGEAKNLVLYIMNICGVIFPIIFTKILTTSHIAFTLAYNEKGLFTGREIIWNQMLKILDNSNNGYLFGLGTKAVISNGDLVSNYHNWYLGVLYTFGIPVFILYFLVVIRAAKKIISYDMFCAFLGVMVLGFFETVGLFGLTQPYFYIILLIGRSNCLGEIKS